MKKDKPVIKKESDSHTPGNLKMSSKIYMTKSGDIFGFNKSTKVFRIKKDSIMKVCGECGEQNCKCAEK